jgi:hypothetical protein
MWQLFGSDKKELQVRAEKTLARHTEEMRRHKHIYIMCNPTRHTYISCNNLSHHTVFDCSKSSPLVTTLLSARASAKTNGC